MLGVVLAAATVSCLPGTPPSAALPAWSPRGDQIAYAVPAAETASIEVARPGTLRPVAGALSYDSPPTRLAWSPVGDTIAFEKRTGAISVLGLGRFGGGVRELVHAEYGTVTELGDWSPDGRELVFGRDGHIHTLDVRTGEIRYLVDGLHPTWSPDGLEIAYAVGGDIRGISPEGGPSRLIARTDVHLAWIAWSPDSTRLAFVGKVIGLVTRFAGQPAYTVPAEPPLAWRPTGIFYNLTGVAPVRTSVWRFDPDTGETTELTHLPVKFDAYFADASRDGLRVAYQLDVDYRPAGVRILDGSRDAPLLACHGTPRADVVRGSRLNDVIRVNGGGADRVMCGRGSDLVYADRRDRVARDCERVVRVKPLP
jgi:dipeptidyl aminopeptidase/acylaminoacyl peptidase